MNIYLQSKYFHKFQSDAGTNYCTSSVKLVHTQHTHTHTHTHRHTHTHAHTHTLLQ